MLAATCVMGVRFVRGVMGCPSEVGGSGKLGTVCWYGIPGLMTSSARGIGWWWWWEGWLVIVYEQP